MIDRIKTLIEGSFSEGLAVSLASLIWSIDAQEHCIPTSDEINEGLKCIHKYQLCRTGGDIEILPSEEPCNEQVSELDIKKSMEVYVSEIGLTK